MFIDGLTESEKHQLALYLREREHTAFLVVKHAKAAVHCMQRDKEIHPIDLKYLNLLDSSVDELFGKHRIGPGLNYDEPRTKKSDSTA